MLNYAIQLEVMSMLQKAFSVKPRYLPVVTTVAESGVLQY
jgi:hypothetical protein